MGSLPTNISPEVTYKILCNKLWKNQELPSGGQIQKYGVYKSVLDTEAPTKSKREAQSSNKVMNNF